MNFPAGTHEWKIFEENTRTIALNILHVPYNTKEICRAYKSKYNNERENHVIFLMINKRIDEI